MGTQPLCIRFFWGQRRESRADCTDKLLGFMKDLGRFAPVFDHNWFPSARKNPDDPRNSPLRLTKSCLDEILKKGVSYTDVPIRGALRPIRDLGFFIWLINDGYDRVTLHLRCGVYTEYLNNSLIIDLPNNGPARSQVFHVSKLVELFRIIVKYWDPDVGQVWSIQISDTIGEQPNDFQVGWLTYVAFRHKQLPNLKPFAETIPIGKAGAVIVATKQRFNIDNTHHVERLKALSKLLNSCPK